MRKSKAETVATRKRIVSEASRVFRAKGIGASSIGDLMSAADLTPGGFYRHFESKEHLVAEANQTAFTELFANLVAKTEGRPPEKALNLIVTSYLQQLQKDDASYLCPLASLGSELGQAEASIKDIANAGHEALLKLIEKIITQMNVPHPAELASSILSLMVGAVTLSRIATDPKHAKSILRTAKLTIEKLVS